MPTREVKIGMVAYQRADIPELWAYGGLGEKVEVHEGDVERFDRFNVAPEAPAFPEPAVTPDDPATPVVEVPGGNASLVAWQDYARANGATDADLDGLGRDEVRERYAPKGE